MESLAEIIGKKYSLNHLQEVTIQAPRDLYEEAVVEVTLSYGSEGMDKGTFTLRLPMGEMVDEYCTDCDGEVAVTLEDCPYQKAKEM